MPYYKNAAGKLYFLDDAKFVGALPTDCVPITDVAAAEILSAQSAAGAAAAALLPNQNGFADALKVAMGGIVGSNALAKAYPLFYPALQEGIWSDVQSLIIDAHTSGLLSDSVYVEFAALARQYNIPVVLP